MGELGKKEEGGVFEGVGLIPQCTLCMILLVFCLARIELYFNILLHSKYEVYLKYSFGGFDFQSFQFYENNWEIF